MTQDIMQISILKELHKELVDNGCYVKFQHCNIALPDGGIHFTEDGNLIYYRDHIKPINISIDQGSSITDQIMFLYNNCYRKFLNEQGLILFICLFTIFLNIIICVFVEPNYVAIWLIPIIIPIIICRDIIKMMFCKLYAFLRLNKILEIL
jgi:hypothetical protein